MPKIKTHSGAKKRFKTTKSGKVKRAHAYTSHILTKKSTKRKRNLRKLQLLMLQTRSSARDLFLTNKKNLLNYLGININSEVYRYGKN